MSGMTGNTGNSTVCSRFTIVGSLSVMPDARGCTLGVFQPVYGRWVIEDGARSAYNGWAVIKASVIHHCEHVRFLYPVHRFVRLLLIVKGVSDLWSALGGEMSPHQCGSMASAQRQSQIPGATSSPGFQTL